MAEERLQHGTLSDELGFLLARANSVSLAAGNEALAPHGLRGRSYSVLAVVADGARPTQRELADFLRLDPSQIVAIVDDLEGRRLVQRRQDAADRRARIIVATAEGERVFAAARESALAAERTAHPGFADEDRASAIALLRTLAFPEP